MNDNAPSPFDRLVRALTSTISLKVAMGITGLLLAGFTLFHMAGHLQVFLGRDAYNDYGEFMQGLGPIKWGARLGLLGILAIHVSSAVTLFKRNQEARPERYAVLEQTKTSLAAMYMFELGLVLFLFIVYHLLHFTIQLWDVHHVFGGINYRALEQITEDGVRHDLYSHFVVSFQQPLIFFTYMASTVALVGHLAHGVSSSFKTLGLGVGRWRVPFELIGPAFAVFVGLGFVAPPLAVFVGIVK